MTRRVSPVLAAFAILAAAIAPVAAHEPDPLLGGQLWAQDQVVSYAWKTGQVPPAWMTSAIDAAAADVGRSRASRAAQFVRVASAASPIAYGEPTGCSAVGIACFDRTGAPSSFKMWFRAHGYAFDWGKLRWCQGLVTIANGCFDVENIALDEFGHVEILGHHANYTDGSDYLDAVVQTVSRARPSAGWDAHAFGRCDVARLQLEYERIAAAALFSTCLKVATTTTLGVSSTSIMVGGTVTFSAILRAANLPVNRALANDPIGARTVLLQRRPPGATAWTTIKTMTPSFATPGIYSTTISPTATYEWRAAFSTPTNEGLTGSSSPVIKITVSGCSGSGCPLSQPLP
jgi:hypothetical protein